METNIAEEVSVSLQAVKTSSTTSPPLVFLSGLANKRGREGDGLRTSTVKRRKGREGDGAFLSSAKRRVAGGKLKDDWQEAAKRRFAGAEEGDNDDEGPEYADAAGGEASVSEESEDEDPKGPAADIPLEMLQQLRKDGVGPSGRTAIKAAREAAVLQYKRLNRHMPAEESAKRPVGRFREVIQVAKKDHRDPRFDAAAGEYSKDKFMKQYNFLYNEVLPAEREQLKKQMKKAKTPEEVAAMKVELGRIQNRLIDHKNQQQQKKIEADFRAESKEAGQSGDKRYYLKKSELKKKMLLEKFKELEKSGKLEKYMEKKRKKNAAKDHKRIPRGRVG